MSYISQIFDRLDLQQICSFLLDGTENIEIDPHSYEERLAIAKNEMVASLKSLGLSFGDYDRVEGSIFAYAYTCRDVYMEIGMQAGAVLASQFHHNLSALRTPAPIQTEKEPPQ